MKTFLQIFLIVLLLAITGYFNYGLIDIRMDEIRYLLGKVASQQNMTNTFGIVAKYELIKRRMLYGEENISNYELEAKVQALTSGDQLEAQKDSWTMKASRAPVRLMLNAIRFLLGKEIISPKQDDKIISVLEEAYFWERNRTYVEALKIYDQVLASPVLSDEIRAAVMVHKGFCYSMMSEYEQSKHLYEAVINNYPNTEAGIISWKLLDFIENMEKERSNLELEKLSELDKAKQFYLLMDFRNAVRNFSIFLGHNPPVELASEARFYKGRSHEELGEIEDAMAEYREVMQIDTSHVWARQANRRMLMLGEFYNQEKQVADQAKKQLAEYQDQTFMNGVEKYADLVSSSSLRNELMEKDQKGPKLNHVDDSLLALLNNIGPLDLTGEADAKKHQEEMQKIQQKLIENGQLTPAQSKEILRKQALVQNPFRRATVLKRNIDDFSSELKYLYNKRLRSGLALSGEMIVAIKIKADGTVGSADILKSSLGDQAFEKEVVKHIISWKFSAVPDSLGEMTVNYPFDFTEEK